MTDALLPLFLAIGLACLILLVTALARHLPIPTPILQLLAGLCVGLVPGLPVPELDPHIVFLVFLPPVLWSAAYFTSLREFTRNLRPISLLAVGLVGVTTAAVALAAHALFPGMPWAVAVALGAIISPPDAVAAEAILKRLPVPRRAVVILEGESLVNDASALVLYRTAVAAAVTGSFSLGEASVRFVVDALVGALIGLFVGRLLLQAARRTSDVLVQVLLTLVGPYVAWVAAELLHVSAVLAVVAGGLSLRQQFSDVVAPAARLQSRAVWELFIFIVNALIFVLLGVQFGGLIEALPAGSAGGVAIAGLLLSALVIVVRLVWVPIATWLPRALSADVRRRDPVPGWQGIFLVSWTSMRGIVSLASALALPTLLRDGTPFPYRTEIILVTMVVILVTLVAQGISLTPIVRALRFPPDQAHHEEARHARFESARHALETLDDLADEPWARADDIARLRAEYQEQSRQHHRRGELDLEATVSRRRLRAQVLRAERKLLVRLRNEGAISDEVLHELEGELDVEALRIGEGARR